MTPIRVGYVDLDNTTTKDQVSLEREGTWNMFAVPHIISKDHAIKLQMELGYHPGGYGFYSFKVENNKTTWQCANSCD